MDKPFDFNERPFLVIWETTHACDLACVHCRAKADPAPLSGELSTTEAKKLLDDVHELRAPIFVFSGGDPLMRKDLLELVRHSKSLKLRTGVIPAVTPLLTADKVVQFKEAGVDQLALSLDAADAKEHDDFRKTAGVFNQTLEAIEWARESNLAVQINSLINVHNLQKLDELITLVETLPIVFWEVFFLVPTGRGKELPMLAPKLFDEAFAKIYALQKRAPFIIKVTEAMHYRKYCMDREGAAQMPQMLRQRSGPGGSIGHAPMGVNSGKGFVFISCTGEIMPSGFLPIAAGNIKKDDLGEVYRNAPLFKTLRDTSLLKGKCGICSYKEICGGSRSRAWALTGDYLAADPCCSYQPPCAEPTACHVGK